MTVLEESDSVNQLREIVNNIEVLSSGSVVHSGEGNGMVLLAGVKTYFGRTSGFCMG